MRQLLLILFFVAIGGYMQAQAVADSIANLLQQKAKIYPELESKINISVSEVTLNEFLRAIAVSNKINLDIDENLDFKVVNNFSGVEVKDMLAFLCNEYDLNLYFTGNIISVRKNHMPKRVLAEPVYDIRYDTLQDRLTFNLKNDSLWIVAKQITKATNINVILAPGLHNKSVSAYIQNSPFESAIDKLAFANNLQVTKTADGFYLLEEREAEELPQATQQADNSRKSRNTTARRTENGTANEGKPEGKCKVDKVGFDQLNVMAEEYPIDDLLRKVSDELNKNYFIVSTIEGVANLNLIKTTYGDFLDHLFDGTKYTFRKEGDYYVVGDREATEIRTTEVIPLYNRTVDKLVETLPDDVFKDMAVKEFPELNCLVVNGPQTMVANVKSFIEKIDKPVPVILIEVLIVYANDTKSISTGIEAGLADEAVSTSGTINPGLDLTLGSESLNKLIESFNGFGWFNLSKVNSNFYMTLSALQKDGIIDIRSTPRLSTLNGHEATMSIGTTEYYLEEQTNIISSSSTQTTTTQSYESVEANLSVTVLPIVSGREDVTLTITVEQTDFTERISDYAPPGATNRKFESMIKVKNEEMILLGGLEENSNSKTVSGWPILSRIPILKWIFSSHSDSKEKSKLNIFIKPTIIY